MIFFCQIPYFIRFSQGPVFSDTKQNRNYANKVLKLSQIASILFEWSCAGLLAVSYTHLDVYKRQLIYLDQNCPYLLKKKQAFINWFAMTVTASI